MNVRTKTPLKFWGVGILKGFIQYVLTNIDYFDDIISLDFGLEFLSFDLNKSQTAVAVLLVNLVNLVHGTGVVKI